MEIWIRSYDKTVLTKVTNIALDEDDNSLFYENGKYQIELGRYKTKERAVEILDEIQTHLLKMGETEMLTNGNGIINGIKYYGIVYEMPQE